jgi:zinc transport system substrate-binding protein
VHLALLVAVAMGCSPTPEEADSPAPAGEDALVVYVTSEPLRAMAERIGGDAIEVHFPAPNGVDPAHWSPDPETVARYQSADLVLRSGAGYDPWIDRATLRERSVVDTSAGYAERLIRAAAPTHQHGPQGEHSHGATAFTTWLDPTLAALQARAVAEALAAARPAEASAFRERASGLDRDLRTLDGRLAAAAARLPMPPLYSHPVYGYLDRRYELGGRSLHWEPDEMPPEREWEALAALLRERPARLILWEAEPLPATMRRLEGLGIESVVFAPCGNRCGEDWLAVVRANAAHLEAAAAAGDGA